MSAAVKHLLPRQDSIISKQKVSSIYGSKFTNYICIMVLPDEQFVVEKTYFVHYRSDYMFLLLERTWKGMSWEHKV